MRPDPNDQTPGTEPARIIYLGEVRRRRASRRVAPDRHYLAALALVALFAWGAWLSVFLALQPARLLTYLAFFIPLFVALLCSSTLALYFVEWRRGLLPRLRRCAVRGAVISLVLVINLAFQAAHAWSVLAFGGTLLVAGAVETLLERRVAA